MGAKARTRGRLTKRDFFLVNRKLVLSSMVGTKDCNFLFYNLYCRQDILVL